MTSFDTWEAPVISLDETSLSQKNKNYFCREYRQPGLGIRSVVQAAFRKSAADDEDLSNDPTCTEEEANFHVMVAKFSKSLTTSQLNTFADILAGLDEGTNDSGDCGMSFTTTRAPKSKRDLNSIYISGRHSIIKNLPRVEVVEKNGHAYTAVGDSFNLLVASGLRLIRDEIEKHSTKQDGATSVLRCPYRGPDPPNLLSRSHCERPNAHRHGISSAARPVAAAGPWIDPEQEEERQSSKWAWAKGRRRQ